MKHSKSRVDECFTIVENMLMFSSTTFDTNTARPYGLQSVNSFWKIEGNLIRQPCRVQLRFIEGMILIIIIIILKCHKRSLHAAP